MTNMIIMINMTIMINITSMINMIREVIIESQKINKLVFDKVILYIKKKYNYYIIIIIKKSKVKIKS